MEISAPPEDVFKIISDLDAWPHHLPHFRWIRVMQNHPDHQIVRMACFRSCIPIDWVVRYESMPGKMEIRFTHLKSINRDLQVTWRVEPSKTPGHSIVTTIHDTTPLVRRWGKTVVEHLIRPFFIDYVAKRALQSFARHFELNPPTIP
ncbi:MAG: SRPBCC family protein [Verrucomicrobiae bacterium]|nr:SRPBCC family protein [Verrucomicrobiae bacterium]